MAETVHILTPHEHPTLLSNKVNILIAIWKSMVYEASYLCLFLHLSSFLHLPHLLNFSLPILQGPAGTHSLHVGPQIAFLLPTSPTHVPLTSMHILHSLECVQQNYWKAHSSLLVLPIVFPRSQKLHFIQIPLYQHSNKYSVGIH